MQKEEIIARINANESEILQEKNYLASKDYQTIREMQGGEPMNELTKKKCSDARVRINELENENFRLRLELENMDDEPRLTIMEGELQ